MAIKTTPFTVILDACVLYPAPIRDLLIEMSSQGLYRAKWTDKIQEEWISNLLEKRSDLDRARLQRTRDLMERAVLDSLVSGYDDMVPSLKLADEDDRHVLAAAIHCSADAIVTFNLKDFPRDYCLSHLVEPIGPDDFVMSQLDLDEAAVLTSAQACRARLRNPPMTAIEYLDILRSVGLSVTAAALQSFSAVL